jgi:hypothetical protein
MGRQQVSRSLAAGALSSPYPERGQGGAGLGLFQMPISGHNSHAETKRPPHPSQKHLDLSRLAQHKARHCHVRAFVWKWNLQIVLFFTNKFLRSNCFDYKRSSRIMASEISPANTMPPAPTIRHAGRTKKPGAAASVEKCHSPPKPGGPQSFCRWNDFMPGRTDKTRHQLQRHCPALSHVNYLQPALGV